MKLILKTHRKTIGCIVAVAALTVALVYSLIIPNQATDATGFQRVILLFAHSVSWLFFGVASLLWARSVKDAWVTLFVCGALGAYGVFLAVIISS